MLIGQVGVLPGPCVGRPPLFEKLKSFKCNRDCFTSAFLGGLDIRAELWEVRAISAHSARQRHRCRIARAG